MKRAAETIPVRRLRRAELPVDTRQLARYLIGKVAVHDTDGGRLSGRIVETEAYPPGDSAGHAFRGETRRNASLFLGRGYAYVYFTYGSSFMLNVTSEAVGVGAGVLLRALEPLEGVNQMQRFRGGAPLLDLARGPGRLAQAMEIDSCRMAWICAHAARCGSRRPRGKRARHRRKCSDRFDAQRRLQTTFL
jgi:DNA-3-methyladenine glycosylase